jgi:hypothetical protein
MKSSSIAIVGCCLLPLATFGSTYSDSLQRLSVEDPEFVFYTDLQNDFSSAGTFLTEAYLAYLSTSPEGVPPIPVDFNRLFTTLGFSPLTGVIATSEANPEFGFTNQMMFTFEEAPSGVFLLAGDRNQPFSIRESAPADAQLVAEMNLNGVILFQIVRKLVVDMMGPLGEGMIDAQMNQPVIENGPTLAEIINRLTTQIQVALKPSFNEESTLPPAMAFFDGHSIIHISNVADLMQSFAPMLQQAGFTSMDEPGGTTWSLSVPAGPVPISVFLQTVPGSNDLIVSFNKDSRDWFLGGGPAIGSSPAFSKSIAGLPETGLSFWYSTAEMSQLQIQNLDAQLPESANIKPVLDVVKRFLMKFTGEQSGVSFLDGNAYRVISFQPTSYKTNLALAGAVIPIGFASSYAATMQEAAAAVEAAEAADDSTGMPEEDSSPTE